MLNLDKYLNIHSPGYVIEINTPDKEEEFIIGNSETNPKIKKCNSNTLYDIASLTKVYTATLIYMAYEENKLSLTDYIYDIDNRFKYLKEIRIIDLLSHNQEIWTNGYLGNTKTKKEFYTTIFSSYIKDYTPTYCDVHYIILSTLLEKIYNLNFATLLQKKIFDKLKFKHTTVNPQGCNIASNNYETLNGEIINNIFPGAIHDTKARVAKKLGITTGHASIFTTGKEFLIFLKSFLDYSLLKPETISIMLRHRDINKENYNILKSYIKDEVDINKMYFKAITKNPQLKLLKTYNYMGTRYSNNIYFFNDIPRICSPNTITFSGYTGPTFIIDFGKKIIVIIMCNVMHNTTLNRFERKNITNDIMEEICKEIY